MKVKSKLKLAPDEKKLGKVEAKFSDGAFKVLGKKNGQLVEVSENPMTYEDAKKFIKEQGIEKYYSNVDIVPYRGNKKTIKYIGKVKRKQTKSHNYSVNVKPKPKTSYHKDVKSHNVNIRVISGINGNLISDIKDKLDLLNKWNKILEKLNSDLKSPTVTKLEKTLLRIDIYRVKNVIKDLKTDISKTQKKVK